MAGLQHLLITLVDNFIGFPPLGVVLAVALGVGVAERAGFLRAAVAATLARIPRKMMPSAVTFVAGQGQSSAKRNDKTFTLGAIFARMALFVLPVLLLWTGILAVFYFGDIPMGPGTTIHLGGTP